MNWKEEAKEKLKKYDAMRQSVVNLPMEIKRLQLAAQSLRGVNPEALRIKSGERSKEEALMNNMVQRHELASLLEQAKSWLQITDRALATLTKEEKLILHSLYIYPQKGALDRLCNQLGVEHSSVYRKRDRALQHFTLALYGVEENMQESWAKTCKMNE